MDGISNNFGPIVSIIRRVLLFARLLNKMFWAFLLPKQYNIPLRNIKRFQLDNLVVFILTMELKFWILEKKELRIWSLGKTILLELWEEYLSDIKSNKLMDSVNLDQIRRDGLRFRRIKEELCLIIQKVMGYFVQLVGIVLNLCRKFLKFLLFKVFDRNFN